MTTRQIMQAADEFPLVVGSVFVALTLAAWVCGWLHGKGNGGKAPWKYIYSFLVYAVSVPGIFTSVLCGYIVFFTEENLMDVSLLCYILPVVAMAVTLLLIRRNVSFDEVPGFDRLSGLMVMIGCSFALALALQKTRIWILAGVSFQHLLLVALGVFALLKWGTFMLFRRRDEPREAPPEFPKLQ